MARAVAEITPYRGLMPYGEADSPFFFGRDTEREIISANLTASRLTLLYGTSGVGKSSVLRAGVAYHLRQLARQNLNLHGRPEFALIVFNSWRDDPIIGLQQRIRESVAQLFNLEADSSLPSPNLAPTLEQWTERVDGDLLIILDQFEEYFLYHAQEDGEGTFAVEFPRAVTQPGLRVNFLVCLREDALAKLDRFKGRIPELFDNYLRVEHLQYQAAWAAIEKPIEQYNSLHPGLDPPFQIESDLVDAVLKQVRTGQGLLGESGRGAVQVKEEHGSEDVRIETPYLQLVMTRLWDEEIRAGSRTLRLETLNRLSGAASIVGSHLHTAMGRLSAHEQDAVAQVFYHLVTPSGTKIAQTVSDLAKYAKMPAASLNPILGKLADPESRILRPVPPPLDQPHELRYEIFHDVLAPAVLQWQARYRQAQRQTEVRQRAAVEANREAEAATLRQHYELAVELERAKVQEKLAREQHKQAEERQRHAEEDARISRRLMWCAVAIVIFSLSLAVWSFVHFWLQTGHAG